MSAATRAQVTRRARQLGASIDYREDRGSQFRSDVTHEIAIEAPNGFIWAGADVHERIIVGEPNAPMSSLYSLALSDMSAGVERCTDVECEWCEKTEEENA